MVEEHGLTGRGFLSMRLPEPYLPKSYKGRVHWCISPYRQSEPIHLFKSQAQAKAWAKSQPETVIGEVTMTPSFDWFPAGSRPQETISRHRQFVDHREES